MIEVLVVDDDFRVAQVHSAFVDGVDGFTTVGRASTAAQARELVAELAPDLVLLDNYLPDEPGVSVAGTLDCDIIMVTADTSAPTLHAAMRAGVLNYVVKPFPAQVLTARLLAYARFRGVIDAGSADLSQRSVDRIWNTLHDGDTRPTPKGQSPATSRLVADALRRAAAPMTASSVADTLGIGRGTAQRYLAAMVSEGRAHMTLRYGTTGRPEHEYRLVNPPPGAQAGRNPGR